MLVLLDSSVRVAGGFSEFTIDLPGSVREISRVSLAYADIPNPAAWNLPAYVISIEGMPAGVSFGNAASGSQVYQGLAQFVVPTEAPAGYRSFYREATSFEQALTLNPRQSFARVSVRILGCDGQPAALTDDSLLILRFE
jgi:hypothetical protein